MTRAQEIANALKRKIRTSVRGKRNLTHCIRGHPLADGYVKANGGRVCRKCAALRRAAKRISASQDRANRRKYRNKLKRKTAQIQAERMLEIKWVLEDFEDQLRQRADGIKVRNARHSFNFDSWELRP